MVEGCGICKNGAIFSAMSDNRLHFRMVFVACNQNIIACKSMFLYNLMNFRYKGTSCIDARIAGSGNGIFHLLADPVGTNDNAFFRCQFGNILYNPCTLLTEVIHNRLIVDDWP